MNSLVRNNVNNLKAYKVTETDYQILLNANESPYNISSTIKNNFIDYLKKIDINRYPDTTASMLREKLAVYSKVDKENIICGNGSDELITMIIQSFVDKDDVVVSHSPSFVMYNIATQIAGGEFIEVMDLNEFVVDIDTLIETTNKNNAKILFLCNPNNPTGYTFNQKDIVKVIEQTNCIVVIDEAYYEFCGQTSINLINKFDNVIVLRTLSKAFGLAGIRSGYAVTNKEIIDILYKVKPPYNLNTLSQVMSIAALDNIDIINKSIDSIVNERERIYNELLKFNALEVFPSKSNFILIRMEKSQLLFDYLLSKSILVKQYKNSSTLDNCIRLTIGSSEENTKLLQYIKEVL